MADLVNGPPLFELRDLDFAWPGGLRLAGLNLRIYPGDLLVLRGEPGAGKSTLLRLMAARLRAASGQMMLRRKPFVENGDASCMRWRRSFGLLDQQLALPGNRSPRELIELCLAGRGMRARERRREGMRLLSETGQLALADRNCGVLSVGQQRWVQLALALAGKPEILLLDEPFHHLGEEMCRELEQWLVRMPQRGTAVMLSSHRPLELGRDHRELQLVNGQLHEATPVRRTRT